MHIHSYLSHLLQSCDTNDEKACSPCYVAHLASPQRRRSPPQVDLIFKLAILLFLQACIDTVHHDARCIFPHVRTYSYQNGEFFCSMTQPHRKARRRMNPSDTRSNARTHASLIES